MRFLTRKDGWNVDKESYRVYERHLDQIRDHLPVSLYVMLRFPGAAYESGRTFYDAVVVEWREFLSRKDLRERASLSILAPKLNALFEFSFDDAVFKSSGPAGSRVGALYAVEASMSEPDVFCFCFLFMSRYEFEIECGSFSFSANDSGQA